MTKRELIQYLNAASDAEAAVYYYEESIGLLRQKLSMLEPAQRPADAEKPELLERKKVFCSGRFIGMWIAGIADVVAIISFLKSMSNEDWGYRLGMSLLGIPLLLLAGFIAGFVIEFIGYLIVDCLLGNIFDFGNVKQKNRMMLLEWGDENVQRGRRYEEACKLKAKAKEEILTAINGLTEKRNEIKRQRDKIYERGVLQPEFQDRVAVNQMRDYLRMGVCDQLEGPHGAYAQYLNDVRANRICARIDDLRHLMEVGFGGMAQMMRGLILEQQKMSSSIQTMGAALDSGISNLQRSMNEGLAASRSYQQSMASVNGYLKNIQTTLSEAAHNEYIALKESNVSGYLHRM